LAETKPHIIAKVQRWGPGIVVYAKGLDERMAAAASRVGFSGDPAANTAAAAVMLKRAVVHEITHILDKRTDISASQGWKRISGWTRRSAFMPAALDARSGEFATPWGARSPAEDLATFAEIFFVPPKLGPLDADQAPSCRFATKHKFFRLRFPSHPDPAADIQCTGPQDAGLHPDRVGEIHILLASPSFRRVASIGGHLVVAVEVKTGEQSKWHTFTLLADDGDGSDGWFEKVVLGIFGGYPSRVVREPYDTTRLRYVETEGRDLQRYRLILDDQEKARLLERLDHMHLYWRRPYLFFQRNCTALVDELINVIETEPMPSPFMTTPDRTLAELSHRERVVPIPPDPERDLSAPTISRLTRRDLSTARHALCGDPFSSTRSAENAAESTAIQAVIDSAAALDQEECWKAAARFASLHAPLDRALRMASTQKDGASASAPRASLSRIPLEHRRSAKASFRDTVSRAFATQRPSGPGTSATPYSPITVGALFQLDDPAQPVPMLFVERALVDLRHSQPRQYAPASGIDLTVLQSSIALGWSESLEVVSEVHPFMLRYQPQTLTKFPQLGTQVRVLSSRMSTLDDRIEVEWAHLGTGLTLTQHQANRAGLTTWLGLDLHTAFATGPSAGPTSTWATLPATLAGTAQLNWPAQAGLSGEWTILPALGTSGENALASQAQASFTLFIGQVKSRTTMLQIHGHWPFVHIGTMILPPPDLRLGLRFEGL
jgi:hypothetical protein